MNGTFFFKAVWLGEFSRRSKMVMLFLVEFVCFPILVGGGGTPVRKFSYFKGKETTYF